MYKLKFSKNFVYVIYSLFLFTTVLSLNANIELINNSIFGFFYKAIRYVSYIGFIIIIVQKKKKNLYNKNFSLWICLILIGIITMITSRERIYLIHILALMAIYNEEYYKILKITIICQLLIFSITILFAVTGITENYLMDPDRMRYSLGFSWVSYAPNLFLILCMEFALLSNKFISKFRLIVLEIINVFLFVETKTKMSFILTTLIILWLYLKYTKFDILKKTIKILSKYEHLIKKTPFFACSMALLLSVYDTSNLIWVFMNKCLSGRLLLSHNGLSEYGITLFGKKIIFNGFSILSDNVVNYNYIDSSYISILVRYGLIMMIAILVLYFLCISKAFEYRNYYFVLFTIIILIFCIEEPILFEPAFNCFLIFGGCNMSKSKMFGEGV